MTSSTLTVCVGASDFVTFSIRLWFLLTLWVFYGGVVAMLDEGHVAKVKDAGHEREDVDLVLVADPHHSHRVLKKNRL